jgi:hypothetical protein
MATCSFLFKGWAITIAAALSAFAAVDTKRALLAIALVSTIMFWGLDGYYLWLERVFRDLYALVAKKKEADIDFSMVPYKGKSRCEATCSWLRTCTRLHLWAFYGTIIVVDVIGIFLIRSK